MYLLPSFLLYYSSKRLSIHPCLPKRFPVRMVNFFKGTTAVLSSPQSFNENMFAYKRYMPTVIITAHANSPELTKPSNLSDIACCTSSCSTAKIPTVVVPILQRFNSFLSKHYLNIQKCLKIFIIFAGPAGTSRPECAGPGPAPPS